MNYINKGKPLPLGSSITSKGVNFSLIATNAEYIEILLFEKEDAVLPKRIFKLKGNSPRNEGLFLVYWYD